MPQPDVKASAASIFMLKYKYGSAALLLPVACGPPPLPHLCLVMTIVT